MAACGKSMPGRPPSYSISESIVALATEFRAAIERCPRERLPIGLSDFTSGACGDAALLLAKYLERNGHTGFTYVLGHRDGCSHAWLRRGELVVDITADQFEEMGRRVIVEERSQWHATFAQSAEDTHHADFQKYDAHTASSFAQTYQLIIMHLVR